MPIAALKRADAAANVNRYYTVEVAADLFGHWIVLRRWGRIGANPRELRTICRTEHEARALAQKIKVTKQRRGYGANASSDNDERRPWIICRGSSSKNVPHLTTHDPVLAKRIWSEVEEIKSVLFEYCMTRTLPNKVLDRGDTGLEQLLRTDDEDKLFERIISRLGNILSAGVSVRQMRVRLAVNQSIAMLDDRTRDNRVSNSCDNVVEMVPRELHEYLNYSVAAFLPRTKTRNRLTSRLSTAGVLHVGDLVKLAEKEVERLVGNAQDMAAIRSELASVGLRFGMKAPLWRRRVA